MFNLSLRSWTMFVLSSIAMYFGAIEFYGVITNFSTQWYWYVFAVYLSMTVNDGFAHYVVAHRRYPISTNRWLYKVLVFLLSADAGFGNLGKFCVVHRSHHAYADQGSKDILNPKIHWWGAGIANPISHLYSPEVKIPNVEQYIKKENERFADIVNDPWTKFCADHQISLIVAYWSVLYLIAPWLLFKLVFLTRFTLSFVKSFGDVFGHIKVFGSYRNFNTKDNSYNNIFTSAIGLFYGTSILHNNHHGNPNPTGPNTHRWFEIELGHYVLAAMRPLLAPK